MGKDGDMGALPAILVVLSQLYENLSTIILSAELMKIALSRNDGGKSQN